MQKTKKRKDMKIVYNNIIPFKGYLAMRVWPFVFVRKGVRL